MFNVFVMASKLLSTSTKVLLCENLILAFCGWSVLNSNIYFLQKKTIWF